ASGRGLGADHLRGLEPRDLALVAAEDRAEHIVVVFAETRADAYDRRVLAVDPRRERRVRELTGERVLDLLEEAARAVAGISDLLRRAPHRRRGNAARLENRRRLVLVD